MGIIREAFFVSQVKRIPFIEIFSPKSGDFILQNYDKVWHFEIWGKHKNKYDENILIVKDDIIASEDGRTIPLRLFGLLKNRHTKISYLLRFYLNVILSATNFRALWLVNLDLYSSLFHSICTVSTWESVST